ncbi:bifunctional oligoribonuclease/PAP phosphatase NrnA [Halobacillus sp. Marseille-Q1614]|uniref:DHH family phosphoesterase n=1 Tax=Halobacillus sp. Marseille-Q1614 TaxID=2709134 RepID=UPI00157023AE|nr:bifunctional oligoribonuclease/PAP phosphatase NrnA [Halobacillus sp. Marseille-Q1614]
MKTQIAEAFYNFSTIIIHRHVRPDPDAYGSQAGLAELLKNSFPDKNVYITGDEEPSLSFLARMDKVTDADYKEALVIVCDTANQARIDDQRYNSGKMLVKIDHHPNVDEYGDINWVDTTASSTSEMIFQLWKSTEDLKMNDEAARLIYAGIVGDTGRFLFPSTTTETFGAASELVNYNFDRSEMYNNMYSTPINVAKLKGYVLQNFTVHPEGYSTVRLTNEILEKFQVTASETSALVGLLGDMDGILAWAYFIEEEDQIRVRLRSKGPVINGIAAEHNGGGHPMAAGASAESWEETEVIEQKLRDVCMEFK